MKKLGLLLASVLLSAGITQAYAKDGIACPSVYDVRASEFTSAFLEGDDWALISAAYRTPDGSIWQTTYRVKMPDVTDPVTAVARGQQYFNKSPLTFKPVNNGTDGNMPVYCFFEPEGSNYFVTATNGVVYGIKRR